MLLRKFTIAAATVILLLPVCGQKVKAATFTTQEVNEVQHYQKEYMSLSKTRYSIANIYAKKPHFGKKFKPGRLKTKYIQTQLAYINYYRSLFGLPAISTTRTNNLNAQKAAAVMAAINANPFVNQHGLLSEKKPAHMSSALWKIAQDTTETSNLNFNVTNQTAGDVITDLITDHYNLNGPDTGHRAWLLSTRLSATGIGAAYGSNGYRYSVQKALNANDMFRSASQSIVTYPSIHLFPLELVKGKHIAWSIYLSNKTIRFDPSITLMDLDTHITYKGLDVKNYSRDGYGNFKTIITYSPGKMPLVSGHEYEVKIGNIYQYTFKLFKQNPINDHTNYAITPSGTYQPIAALGDHLQFTSPVLLQSAKTMAVISPKATKSPASFDLYTNLLKKGKWHQNFFIRQSTLGADPTLD